jgi:hypothetical protein
VAKDDQVSGAFFRLRARERSADLRDDAVFGEVIFGAAVRSSTTATGAFSRASSSE